MVVTCTYQRLEKLMPALQIQDMVLRFLEHSALLDAPLVTKLSSLQIFAT